MKALVNKYRILTLLGLLAALIVLGGCMGSGEPNADAGSELPAEESGQPEDAQDEDGESPELLAVEFPPDAEWVNTAPLTMEELRGRYVLLDFWTYGCINCYHMVPHLNALQSLFEDDLVVVGVHSAKFTHESETENIRSAVQRYNINYPVVNDAEMVLWQSYHVPGWPTILLIDPEGSIIGGHVGEWPLEMMVAVMEQQLDGDDSARPALPAALQQAGQPQLPPTVLRFPEGIYWDGVDELLYVADTGNNRVIVLDTDSGTVQAVYGDGTAGLADGEGTQTRFLRPRGIARLGDIIYVADTGNHAIRAIDPRTGAVSTVARGELHAHWGLRSPWGLASDGTTLYIGNAGEHQIWYYDPETGEYERFAGSGIEGVRDGEPTRAEFAQPSGLFVDGSTLWVADPESSAIRAISLPDGEVRTLVGTGLFDFGDQDGPVGEALLMHAADVAVVGGNPIVLDTYNAKVKRVIDDVISTLPIPGLNEPSAVSVQGNRLWIADTNNHRVVSVDVEGGTPQVLRIAPAQQAARTISSRQNLQSGALELELSLPDGWKLNVPSPNTVVIRNVQGEEHAVRVAATEAEVERVRIPWAELISAGIVDEASLRQSVQVELWLYYCEREDETVCLFDGATYTVAIESDSAAQGATVVAHPVGGS